MTHVKFTRMRTHKDFTHSRPQCLRVSLTSTCAEELWVEIGFRDIGLNSPFGVREGSWDLEGDYYNISAKGTIYRKERWGKGRDPLLIFPHVHLSPGDIFARHVETTRRNLA